MDDNANAARTSNPAVWLDAHGDALYRFALLRVRDPAVAEDLVQDTLLAALRARDRFEGAASERTWLTAILKNKIIDHFRRATREVPLPDAPDTDAALEAMFELPGNGHWRQPPSAWSDPDTAFEQRQFWSVFQDCLGRLPERQAQVFGLSEFDGLDTEALCKALGASPSNVWVLLHRARLRLRDCLEQHWFGPDVEKR